MSFRSFALPSFWKCYHALPEKTKPLADTKYALFEHAPYHPSLGLKQKGEVWTVDLGRSYRAIAYLSVAAKKGTKMAAKWPPARGAVRSEPFPLLRSVFRNGPEPSRARRCWARRSEPLTARTVLR